ncbi:unnamed protein product [Ranitomeya imitator]|uniref:BEN domain-containing protein n=1 Tax=Ranitomeya imitator TaxID=111125 RepID=A0ABN9MKE4_9NEOB|nr:unnamed protein product [Ranitomeya imitator]
MITCQHSALLSTRHPLIQMCSWQKGLMSSCRNLSWTPYYLTIRDRVAYSLGNSFVLFSMIKLWQHLYPMEKGKRGLNDNRQGLDQNIVGAIKVFTEKYCTANSVEKVPGPRHWVQILQDQIKLARRRLKRGCDLGLLNV